LNPRPKVDRIYRKEVPNSTNRLERDEGGIQRKKKMRKKKREFVELGTE